MRELSKKFASAFMIIKHINGTEKFITCDKLILYCCRLSYDNFNCSEKKSERRKKKLCVQQEGIRVVLRKVILLRSEAKNDQFDCNFKGNNLHDSESSLQCFAATELVSMKSIAWKMRLTVFAE